jgi:hypothetical protein
MEFPESVNAALTVSVRNCARERTAQNQSPTASFQRAPAPTDVGVHRMGDFAAPALGASAGDRVEKPPRAVDAPR